MPKTLALLPEIIFHIGDHIRERDLLSCLFVSHAMACTVVSSAASSSPSTTRTNQPSPPSPSSTSIATPAPPVPVRLPDPFHKLHGCTHLSHLSIDINLIYLSIYDNDSANMPRALLRGLNPELSHSTAEEPPKHVFSTGSFWRVVGSCPQLVRVELFMVMIQAHVLMSFLHACANVKHLTMFHTTITIEGAMPEIERDMPTFARLEGLIWTPVFGQFEEVAGHDGTCAGDQVAGLGKGKVATGEWPTGPEDPSCPGDKENAAPE
ncbi:hypothetical protein BG006_001312 [Podila minutissima]|uniref:Uncharacterized protein n=1 Tax=Podila minutissima TaxID=64525 RepID=A0A9P5SCY8_9FUNG|nr:hypothetical protein BG006_001312 [Podila minutissima]